MKKTIFLLLLILSGSLSLITIAQEKLPKVYIDCRGCDLDYIREKIQFVNIVIDRLDSDIQIFETRLRTGSGGREFSLIFIGRNQFEGMKDTMKYFSNRTDTENTIRDKMVSALQRGLFRFLYKTPLAEKFVLKFIPQKEIEMPAEANDKWDYWVFRSSFRSFLNGEKFQQFGNLWGSLSASRVTEEWKIRFFLMGQYNESRFEFNNKEIVNITRSQFFRSSVIKSLSEHWSAGFWLNANSSTFRNIDYSISIAPGIEYNIYPYSETNVRRLKFSYRVWADYNDYTDMTIYFKNTQLLFQQKFTTTYEIIKDWGNIGIGVSFNSYLHDLSKNSVEIAGEISLQLIKGLTFDISGGYEAVHDQ